MATINFHVSHYGAAHSQTMQTRGGYAIVREFITLPACTRDIKTLSSACQDENPIIIRTDRNLALFFILLKYDGF
jgi:hypothetical protein